jgi:hypothetical protein
MPTAKSTGKPTPEPTSKTAHEQIIEMDTETLKGFVLAAVRQYEDVNEEPLNSTKLVRLTYDAAGLHQVYWNDVAGDRILRVAAALALAQKLVKYKRGESYPSLLRRVMKGGGKEPRWATPARDAAARGSITRARDEEAALSARQKEVTERAGLLGIEVSPGGRAGVLVLSLESLTDVMNRLTHGE